MVERMEGRDGWEERSLESESLKAMSETRVENDMLMVMVREVGYGEEDLEGWGEIECLQEEGYQLPLMG